MRVEGVHDRVYQGVFNHFIVGAGTQQQADGWILVGLTHITVQSLKIKAELAEVFRLKATDFQFDGYQGVQAAMKEQQVEGKISAADLEGIFRADKTKVAAQFGQK